MARPEIRRLYYSIKEVCRMAEITPYTLKSWEKKFPQFRPAKNKSGKRLYKPDDIHLILKIRDWVKQGIPDLEILRILEGDSAAVGGPIQAGPDPTKEDSEWIMQFKQGLQELLDILKEDT
jgi:DNA-binding transcriptional MerR regulator